MKCFPQTVIEYIYLCYRMASYNPPPENPQQYNNNPYENETTTQTMQRLSPEEQRVMAACQSESFWYRSVPMSGFLAMLAGVGVQNGYLSPSPKYGNRPKVILGSIIGYFLGKFSYANTCADKFLVEAPDSHIADMIR